MVYMTRMPARLVARWRAAARKVLRREASCWKTKLATEGCYNWADMRHAAASSASTATGPESSAALAALHVVEVRLNVPM